MIPLARVTEAVVGLLREAWPDVGDGEPPTNPGSPYALVVPVSAPPTGQGMSGGETGRWHRVRVTTVGGAGSPRPAGMARREAEDLADVLRGVLLDRSNRLAGDGWVVTGRRGDGYAPVPGDSTFSVHQDFLLYVAGRPVHPEGDGQEG